MSILLLNHKSVVNDYSATLLCMFIIKINKIKQYLGCRKFSCTNIWKEKIYLLNLQR